MICTKSFALVVLTAALARGAVMAGGHPTAIPIHPPGAPGDNSENDKSALKCGNFSTYTQNCVYCGSWGGRNALMKTETNRPDYTCDVGLLCGIVKPHTLGCVAPKKDVTTQKAGDTCTCRAEKGCGC